MNTISVVVSIITLAFSIFVYFTHKKKLDLQQTEINEQQKILNDYGILKIKNEEIDRKKAYIKAEVIRSGRSAIIIVSNIGKSEARNVKCNITELDQLRSIRSMSFPADLMIPGDKREIKTPIIMGMPSVINIECSWDEEYKESNISKQQLQLF